jgi:hypothetical protein
MRFEFSRSGPYGHCLSPLPIANCRLLIHGYRFRVACIDADCLSPLPIAICQLTIFEDLFVIDQSAIINPQSAIGPLAPA